MWNLQYSRNEPTADSDTENRLVVFTRDRNGRARDWEFGVKWRKLLILQWMNDKILLYSTGTCIQAPGINHAFLVTSVMSDSLWPYGPQPTRFLCPCDSPGNTGVCCHALLQGIFQTQGSNLPLLHLPALAARFFTTSATWEGIYVCHCILWIPISNIKISERSMKLSWKKFWP